jgi:hypothetical protein
VQGLGASIGSRPSVNRGQLQVRAAESKDTSSEQPKSRCNYAGWLAGGLCWSAGWLAVMAGCLRTVADAPNFTRQLISCAAHVTPSVMHCRADHPA